MYRRRIIQVRPIFPAALAFMFGIWISSVIHVHFIPFLAGNFFLLGFSFFFLRRKRFFILSFAIFLMIGILFGTESRLIPKNGIGRAALEGFAILEGKVISIPEVALKGKKETVSFVLETRNFFRAGKVFQTQGKVQIFLHNANRTIHFGDDIRIKGRFEAPKEVRNPHVFDYHHYLRQNGIHAVFRGIGKFSIIKQRPAKSADIFLKLNQLRTHLKDRLSLLFPNPHDQLASALILGFKKNIPRDIKDDFIKTGTAHLLAISGFNITLVGGFFYLLLTFFRLPRGLHLSVTIILIAIYTILAGADPPVLRAGIMGIVILLGFLMEEDRHIKSALCFAFFAMLVMDPKMLFLASFQLSFLATASLIFILPRLEKILFSKVKKGIYPVSPGFFIRFWKFVAQIFLTSFSVTVGMFPLLIWYFNQFSLSGFLANAFAIPVCTIAIVATLIVLFIDLTGVTIPYISMVPVVFLDLELKIVRLFAQIPFGYFYFPRPSWFFFVSYYGFLVLWLLLSEKAIFPKWRKICLSGFVLTIAVYLIQAQPEKSSVQFFDLGKTNAALISLSNGGRVLINTGRRFPNDQAYWTIRPYLMAEGIDRLDGVLMTKVDHAHSGGFKTLTSHAKIKNLWIPEGSDFRKRVQYVSAKKIKPTLIRKGDKIQFGSDPDVYIEILDTQKSEITAILISDGGHRMLYSPQVHREARKVIFKE